MTTWWRDGGPVTTPAAPRFSSPEEYRESNRRMAEDILAADPAPYVDGDYVRRVVEIRGRRSHDHHRVPIAVVTLGGNQYLVSPVLDRNWVKNLLHDPEVTILTKDGRDPRRGVPVADPDEAANVVSTYLSRMNAPWAISQFPFPRDASLDQIRRSIAQLAVFRLEPDANA